MIEVVVSTPTRQASDRVVSAALVAICLAYFMVILDSTIVNVALPALRDDLGSTVSGLQWVVDGYLLVFAALLLTGGALADRLGARRVFQAGLGVFVVASLGCGLAPNIPVLVVARLVQGAGAALAVPASLALLRTAYPDATMRARAIGVWGGIAGLGAASGPILGGLLVSAANWRLVFFVNVPIGLISMLLTARYVPHPERRPRALDLPAQVVEVLALSGLTFALIEGGRDGLTPVVVAGGAVFVLGLLAFVAIERSVAYPMLPLELFGHRTFTVGNVVGLLINLGFYGELFVINLYFQQVRGYSALVAGLALLPQMGVVALGSALSGRFTSRIGSPRPTMLIGLVCGGIGLLALTITGADTAYLVLVAPLVLAGFGMSFTMPAVTTAVVESVPAERSGLASGAINAARQVGSVIGVALLGALVGTGSSVPGLRLALVIGAAVFLAGALLVATAIPQRVAHD
jgi:DHA2 family methylenomycin A resistance protein-like MFS transporter